MKSTGSIWENLTIQMGLKGLKTELLPFKNITLKFFFLFRYYILQPALHQRRNRNRKRKKKEILFSCACHTRLRLRQKSSSVKRQNVNAIQAQDKHKKNKIFLFLAHAYPPCLRRYVASMKQVFFLGFPPSNVLSSRARDSGYFSLTRFGPREPSSHDF